MHAAQVDVVIVNWNSGDQLKESLRALAMTQPQDCIASVTIVDNASHDHSADALDGPPLPITVIRNDSNRGFGVACNQGAALGRAPFILLLNPDTRVSAEAVPQSLRFLHDDSEQRFAVVGARLVDATGHTARTCARFPSPGMWVAHAFGLAALFPRQVPSLHRADWDHSQSSAVDHVMGAFYLLRRSVFEELGGFDPLFFVYLEDLDLSLRIRQRGKEIFFLADAVVFHKGGGTSEQVVAKRTFYALSSRVRYSFKHFSLPAAALVTAATMFVEPCTRLIREVLSVSGAGIRATAAATLMLWMDAPASIRAGMRSRG